jgi:hypothetical protein
MAQQTTYVIAKSETEIERQALLSLYGEDNWPDETVLSYERRFGHSASETCDTRKSYRFVALKCNGKWYMTGKLHEPLTWVELVTHATNGLREYTPLWRVTQYEQVA